MQEREVLGRKVKSLRREGFIPAELYGQGLKNLHLTVKTRDFQKVFLAAGENQLVTLLVNGEKRPVMIYKVARHPLSGEILNIDFYQVRLDEKIRVRVPLEFVGESPAVKAGGILIKALSEVEVEATPHKIPHSFTADLSLLKAVGHVLHLKDIAEINKDKEIKILVGPETVVATVKEAVREEEAPEAEQLTVESVVVETEEKKKEREEKEELDK